MLRLGLSLALVLIPQSMAYAQLAGMPAYYGLYASFLPPLIAAMTRTADDQNYANVRVFEKPGTGGACDDACLEQNVLGNVRFNQQITNFTNAVVMGFDGSICVGKTIFGGWRTDTQQGQVINEVQQQTVREYYERGLLDLGLNVITSRLVNICGNVGGAMVNGYLKFND